MLIVDEEVAHSWRSEEARECKDVGKGVNVLVGWDVRNRWSYGRRRTISAKEGNDQPTLEIVTVCGGSQKLGEGNDDLIVCRLRRLWMTLDAREGNQGRPASFISLTQETYTWENEAYIPVHILLPHLFFHSSITEAPNPSPSQSSTYLF